MGAAGKERFRVERDGAVLRVALDHPATLNALTTEMLTDLAVFVEGLARDDTVRVVVLTGAGKAFCSGAALGDVGSDGGPDSSTVRAAERVVLAVRELGKPVVAAVNGVAAGAGCSLALACDLIIAKRSASFLLAFANVGLMPDGGATALVPAAVGRARAMRMAMLAERVTADTAAEWGLITSVVDDGAFDGAVAELVARLAAGPPLAYARLKHAINEAALDQLTAALDREFVGQDALLASKDFAEGVRAFRGRRAPRFTGE
jgi:enoyl-CoA hydratase